jgi:hypothetical protein
MSLIQFLAHSLLPEKMSDFALLVTPFTQDRAKPTVVDSTLGENNCSLVRLHSSTTFRITVVLMKGRVTDKLEEAPSFQDGNACWTKQ